MSKPIRIQRKRTSGFRLQDQSPDGRPVVSVCRPGKWGNPFELAQYLKPGHLLQTIAPADKSAAAACAVSDFRKWAATKRVLNRDWLVPLRGKHLACFCALDAPCHADVLLELANA